MSAGLLLVTHPGVGKALRETAEGILPRLPLAIATLSPGPHDPPETTLGRVEAAAAGVDSGDGVLILTDAFGATPANIAIAVARGQGYPVITGVNLPMLLRVLNYPELSLESLARMALAAARDGILEAVAPAVEPPGANHGVG
ncbi:PTS fructose transporter subunit IIA [Spiribacter sp. 1M153]|uniref:PTS sugar transporter subunit IIA n=1 Tax=Spiribacter roseus TaxID=1855875 RepID=UPI001330CCDC|nr:PTS fructose transporter subunit IIA [Spiribacter roseus]KAF0282557.1 hypothetical protein BA900_06630 [Spiribacter roseus]